MMTPSTGIALKIRELVHGDLEGVIRIDAEHTGRRNEATWKDRFDAFLPAGGPGGRVGLAAEEGDVLVGYLLGEVRAFEFGSEPCGWVFAIGVDRRSLRAGVGTALLRDACRRFRSTGVRTVRTMVSRADVSVLSFFRSGGFVGGPFVQMEIELAEVKP